MCPSAPRVCSEPGDQRPVLSLSLDRVMTASSRYLSHRRPRSESPGHNKVNQTTFNMILFLTIQNRLKIWTITLHFDICPTNLGQCFLSAHYDVIKWNHFPRYWSFMGGIHRSSVVPFIKASDAELWRFLWSAPEETDEPMIQMPVIWDAIALILTSP